MRLAPTIRAETSLIRLSDFLEPSLIHVADLASGHVAALKHLDNMRGMAAINLGTGRGLSVL